MIRQHSLHKGLTLIELLVVLAILAVLVGLGVPAAQRVHEAARRAQCLHNLKQIGLGCLAHESLHGHYPSGGWGTSWLGEADRGVGASQPGGWIYQLLPFLGQDGLRRWGAGLPRPEQLAINAQLAGKPLALMTCPTRRDPTPFPPTPGSTYYVNCADTVPLLAHTDYAANCGDSTRNEPNAEPPSLAAGDSKSWWALRESATRKFTGVVFVRSQVRLADITHGTTNTYLIGEKYINALNYTNAQDEGDDESMYQGMDSNVARSTIIPPLRDRPLVEATLRFGSAHPAGCNMLYCDGRVQTVAWDVEPLIHRQAGNRRGP